MAIALALSTLIAVVLAFDRIRRARANRTLLNALKTAGSTSGDPFFQTLPTHLDRASRGDPAAIADLSNVFAERAFLEMQRRQSDQALQASEAKTRAILQAQPDLMFVQDRNGTYLDFYAASELYTPPDFFMGKTFQDVLPADTVAIIAPAFRRVVESGQSETIDYELSMAGEVRSYE